MPQVFRNHYPEPDRMAAQEHIAHAVETDPDSFLAAYRALPQSHDGRYICSDLVKETFPEFAASPEGRARYNNPLHNSAAALAAEQLQRQINDPSHPERDTVIFLTGIPGAGKTSAVTHGQELEPNICAVFEGQLANADQAIQKIQAVLDAGLKPAILVVHAKAEFALKNTLDRFEQEGRGASIHAMATIQSKLPDGLTAIRDTFGDKVRFDIFDRTAGFQNAIQHQGWDKLKLVSQEGSYVDIRERLTTELNRQRNAGNITHNAYLQANGKLPESWSRQADLQDAARAEPTAPQVNQSHPGRRRDLSLLSPYIPDGTIPPDAASHGDLRFWEVTHGPQTTKYAIGFLEHPETPKTPRDLAAQRAVSRGSGFDAGHLIGHQFGGPEIPGNLSLQNPTMNQGGGNWYKMETDWASSLRADNRVAVVVREVTRSDIPSFLYRTVNSLTVTPEGKVQHNEVSMLNPETERALAAQGRPSTPTLPDGGIILDLKPLLERQDQIEAQAERYAREQLTAQTDITEHTSTTAQGLATRLPARFPSEAAFPTNQLLPNDIFDKHAANLRERYGYGLDPAKADSIIAHKMASVGWSPKDIASALEVRRLNTDITDPAAIKAYAERLAVQATTKVSKERARAKDRSNDLER